MEPMKNNYKLSFAKRRNLLKRFKGKKNLVDFFRSVQKYFPKTNPSATEILFSN